MFVTPLYAGLLALLFLFLSIRVVRIRHAASHSATTATSKSSASSRAGQLRRVRASRAPDDGVSRGQAASRSILLHAFGLTLLIARLIHGAALSFGLGAQGPDA
jgi:uncharacterized membrane protein YecN with MAPEG domain